jgi:hypothetical protein
MRRHSIETTQRSIATNVRVILKGVYILLSYIDMSLEVTYLHTYIVPTYDRQLVTPYD